MTRFEEVTDVGRQRWKGIAQDPPSDQRDRRINQIIQPASPGILGGKVGPAQKPKRKRKS